MGISNTKNLQRVRHYEEAHRYFTQTAKPRSSTWADNQRPLGSTQQHHYRIEQGGDHYDVILYSTTMARFYAPNSAGETRICYNGDGRNTSTSFMAQVLGVHKVDTYKDTEGVERRVPIGSARNFSTDLWFNKEGELMVAASTHAPIASVHASKALSAWKARRKRKLDTTIALMEIAVQDTLDEGVGRGDGTGDAFQKLPVPFGLECEVRSWVMADCPPLIANGYENLRELYSICAKYIIDRRIVAAIPARYGYKKVTPYVTPKAASVTTSVLNYLAKFAPYSVTKNEHRPLPQFPTELPSSWTFE